MTDSRFDQHEHQWGEFHWSPFGGSFHRDCLVVGCNVITLDGDDDDMDSEDAQS